MKKMDAEMKTILTPEQYQLFEKKKQERKKQRMEQRKAKRMKELPVQELPKK